MQISTGGGKDFGYSPAKANAFTPVPTGTPTSHQQDGGNWFLPWRFGIFLGILIITAFPLVIAGLETFAYLDFGQFAYPVAFYQRECFWRGELPFWNPLSNCGTPFLAQWNTMTLYPPSLFYLLLPLPWSLNVFLLLHLFLGGMGMYFLAHRWTGNRLAAAAAGTVFAFNGLTWYALIWPHITAALAWMPWVVLVAERAWREGGRLAIAAALLAGLQLLSGGAEVIILTWFLLAVLWLAALFRSPIPRTKLILRVLTVGGLAAGLAAVQLLPFLDLLAHSQRTVDYGDPDLGVMPLTGFANYLVPIFRCLRNPQGLFVPPNHWTGSYYLGVGIIVLALWAAWRVPNQRMRLLMGLVVFGLLMALGGRGLVYDFSTRLMPLLGLLRFPVKFVILPTFILPLCAAVGLAWLQGLPDDAWTREFRKLRWLAVGLAGATLTILWCAAKYPLVSGTFPATLWNGLLRLLFLGLILGCVAWLRKRPDFKTQALLQSCLILMLWFDVLTHNSNLSPSLPSSGFEPDVIRQFFKWDDRVAAGASRLMQGQASYHKILSVGFQNLELDTNGRRLSQFFDFNLLDHTPKLDGFYSLDLKAFSKISRNVYYSTNETSRLQDFLGVSYTSNPTNIVDWVPRDSFLPLVTAGQRPVFADPVDTLATVIGGGFEPLRTVYLPFDALGKIPTDARSEAKILSTRFSAHRLDIEVNAESPAMVVIAQAFYHNWHAYVDGQSSSLWKANYAFQALSVPAGRHQVSLVYEDKAFYAGALLSLITALICGIAWSRLRATSISPVTTPASTELPFGPDQVVESAQSQRRHVLKPRLRSLALNLCTLLAALILAVAISEMALRHWFRESLAITQDERNLFYRHDPRLGWFPIANKGNRVVASRPFTVIHNRDGFRSPERKNSRAPGILFLGDSFVWGYDAEASERFTDKLQEKHPDWNVYNLGVSGYGTDQEYLLLQQQFENYKPRVVFLVFCTENDHDDNSSNVRYNGYYKPYYTVADGQLQLRGLPVPRSEKAFLAEHPAFSRSYLLRLIARAYFKFTAVPPVLNPDPSAGIFQDMRDYVRSHGATLVVGLTSRDANVELVLQREKIPYVDLSTPLRYPGFGEHWTPAGHSFVHDKIDEFLLQGKFLEHSPPAP